MINFKSDNTIGVHPKILNAIVAANSGTCASYGGDQYSKQLKVVLSEIFEKEIFVFLTSTGTAANSLALSALVKPYQYIACHKYAHINTNECGGPILFTGGASPLGIEGQDCKIHPVDLKAKIIACKAISPHSKAIGCLSLTQANECGTAYELDEIQVLTTVAKEFGLTVHMDGARFTNALVNLGCSPADMTWRAGIDVLCFGATKNGCLNAEAIIFFNANQAANFDFIHKRGGQLMSKTRFFSAQFLAYFKDNLWLENAQKANSAATSLATVFQKHGITLAHTAQTNMVFPILEDRLAKYLSEKGCGFYPWESSGKGAYRFVASFATNGDEVAQLDELICQFEIENQ